MTDVYYLPIEGDHVKPADGKYHIHDQLLQVHIHRQTNKIHHDRKPAMVFPNRISVWAIQGVPYGLELAGQYYTVFPPKSNKRKWRVTSTRKINNVEHITYSEFIFFS